jgi:Icc-related predicted phosphoesterase
MSMRSTQLSAFNGLFFERPRRFPHGGSVAFGSTLDTHTARMAGSVVRLAAVGDLHCTKTSQGTFQSLFARVAQAADVLLIAGDLTDYGHPDEARVLARELNALRIPVAAVFGNHDLESGKQDEIRQILTDAGAVILNGDACEMHGIGIAGVKGFGGGFGQRALGPWGETIIKQFVHEAVDEALKLEAAMARLRTSHLVALLHYAPVQSTVLGEPLEIYPFLGSSRLEEPLGRYPVSLVVHGHAHRGQLEGATRTGVPVYNVSMPLLTRSFPDKPPFRVFDVMVGDRRAGDRRLGETPPAHSTPPADATPPSAAPVSGPVVRH